jgi:hydrogenase 3 maturation protease
VKIQTRRVRPACGWKAEIRKAFRGAERIAILGVGRESMGDDAAGVLCTRRLKRRIGRRERNRIRVYAAYETPENFSGKIRAFQPSLVLILDAASSPPKARSVFLVDRRRIRDEGASTHAISLIHLAHYIEKTMDCRVIILGIQPKSLEPETNVSPSVERASTRLADQLVDFFFSSQRKRTFGADSKMRRRSPKDS